eukprot:TRINITY_DN44773_c1_g1_i1.p3 TRINITY_DN44773_c1_g1~~TRINITY_DN44773_c1_g1_i1.p3  ORF type:complete len:185 (-),score=15.37 TRINITY_DN44773_c1_g1_i1:1041-1595(-)
MRSRSSLSGPNKQLKQVNGSLLRRSCSATRLNILDESKSSKRLKRSATCGDFAVLEKEIFRKEECDPVCVWDRIDFVREQCEGLLPDERCECYEWYGVDDVKIDKYYYTLQRIESFAESLDKSEAQIYLEILMKEVKFRLKVLHNRLEELVPAPQDLDWETVQYLSSVWKDRLLRYFHCWMKRI